MHTAPPPSAIVAELRTFGEQVRAVVQRYRAREARLRAALERRRNRETRLLILLGRAEAVLPADDPLTREIAAVLRPSTLPATDTGD